VADGRRHQLWFDTPRSFGLKASMAIDTLKFRGIGLWLPELAATATQAAEMWRAIPSS
jgi:spore germination protein YaaH